MHRNEHKRVKHGHVPGDIHKQAKIAMRENKGSIIINGYHVISEAASKVYRRMLAKKSKKRQRRRDRERIQDELF